MTRIPRALVWLLVVFSIASRSPAIGPNGVEDAISALFAAARAGDDTAAMKAAVAVVAFREEAASKLAASVTDRTPGELVWALRCLREIGAADGKETAFSFCSHAHPGVRTEAVWTAYWLGQESALPLLIRASADPESSVRRRAFDGIVAHGAARPEALEVAIKGVVDADFWVVLASFEILDRQPPGKPDKVVAALDRIVTQLDDRNAAAAFDLLERRAGAACASSIETGLSSTRTGVVVAALKVAGNLRLAALVPSVSLLAKGSDLKIGKVAIDSLARIGDPASVEFLVNQLATARDPARVDAIAVALRTLTGQLFGADVEKWRRYLAQRPR